MLRERSLSGTVETTARIIVFATTVAACKGGPSAPAPSPEINSFLAPSANETVLFIGSTRPTPEPGLQSTTTPSPTPDSQPTESPTPAERPTLKLTCQYKDLQTPLINYDDWALTLVDTTYELPKTYEPNDLVNASAAGLNGGLVRSIIIPDLKDLTAAAKKAGAPLAVQSAFRSYTTQVSTFNSWVSVSNYQSALLASARPGHSEHQLGTTIDFRGVNDTAPWNYADWAKTKTGAWMAANAWKYGFVMSYPSGSSPSKTCYQYEPWHYRYLGKEEALEIRSSGLSPREWLLRNQPSQ